jgi:hypothetical protein
MADTEKTFPPKTPPRRLAPEAMMSIRKNHATVNKYREKELLKIKNAITK